MLSIRAIETALPALSASQSELCRLECEIRNRGNRDQRYSATLHRTSRVKSRGSVLLESDKTGACETPFFRSDPVPGIAERMRRFEAEAAPLAVAAAHAAIKSGGVCAADFQHLVTICCTGFNAPGIDAAIIENCGLPATVHRTNVGFMGCHGALNGLRVADAVLAARPTRAVLLSATELCSLHYHFGDERDARVANALFADGSAALVGMHGSGSGDWSVLDSASWLIPGSKHLMSWRIFEDAFRMTLSSELPGLIERVLVDKISAWLNKQSLDLDAIQSWAVHPGGPKILEACATALNIAPGGLDDSFAVLAEYGNMSSPTLLFVLKRMIERGAGLPCVALGFGPGISVEAVLFG